MSDVMLHAVLCMPIELWGDDLLDKVQRHSRYLDASERIQADAEKIERMEARIKHLETRIKSEEGFPEGDYDGTV